MVTLTLSNAVTPAGAKMGRLVGATVLGFEQRGVPHCLKRNMTGQIRRWHNAPDKDKDDRKRKSDERPPPKGGRAKHWQSNAAWSMGGGSAGAGVGSAAATKWGHEPAGGWALEQQNRWNDEEKTRNAWAKEMKARVDKELDELGRNPETVSKKIVDAIGQMGMKPARAVVYGWTGQQSGSGFCDLAPSILHYNWF
jgi:hypothetical protein